MTDRRRIYLLRHGAVDYFPPGGPPVLPHRVPLSEEGRAQAAAAAAALAEVEFDRAVVSGLPRTVETAEIVLAGRRLELERVPALEEIRSGRVSEIPEDELEAAFLAAFDRGPEASFLGGETFASLFARVVPAFEEIVADSAWSSLLMVLHGAVNRTILAHLLGADIGLFGALEQDPACINVLDVGAGGAIVRLLNYTAYNATKAGLSLTTMEELYRLYRRS